MRHQGLPISALYPSRVSTYRRAGYELAGKHTRYRAKLSDVPAGFESELEPWGDEQLPEIIHCYRQLASNSNGMLNRDEDWFKNRILKVPDDQALYRYLYRESGEATGYLVFTQESATGPIPFHHDVRTRDLVWTDESSSRAISGFFGRDTSLGSEVTWLGPTEEPLSLLFKQQSIQVDLSFGWMQRLVDVTAALEARGYPPSLETSVEFTVKDDLIAENNQSLRLEVGEGSAKALPREGARARVDVSTLAAMYTGWLPAREAVRAGRIEDASDSDIERLELIFSGPKPWMMDFF